jgi:uncharacterized protein (DUF433 family)
MHPRITINPNQMSGEPCIRGLRIPVATVVALVAELPQSEILRAYPDLEPEDVTAALRFAAQSLREHQIPTLGVA